MKKVLSEQGPISVAISDKNLTFYKSGIMLGKDCGDNLGHAVLIVGFDKDAHGKEYWIVKNSYGQDWGQKGYFWLEIGTDACGVSNDPTIITVEKVNKSENVNKSVE